MSRKTLRGGAILSAFLLWLILWIGCVYVAGDQVGLKIGNFGPPQSQPAASQPVSGEPPVPEKTVDQVLKEILP